MPAISQFAEKCTQKAYVNVQISARKDEEEGKLFGANLNRADES